ncbi:nuclear transport factor 2 family protein [Spongiivirga sp. MCCC 1A20706]|uniref:YybH family protein n=1 Tax=Spongiivirga sp. MCCC 1A20706 TaxID=3160963 RepID=UPI003977CB38
MKHFKVLAMLLLILTSCNNSYQNDEKWKKEIIQVEKDFNDMAQKEGLVKAFEYYAAKDGVIRRGKKVIKGKESIAKWYQNDVRPNETLTWKPTFVDVSVSGDLAYTYGDYVFTSLDSLGNKKENKGIFHTVWKRQKDGNWRFVWD